MIRCLHVDDDALVRRGFEALLRRAPQYSVVASVGSAAEARATLSAGLDFEVAVIDLGLPDESGLEVIRAVRRARPNAVPVVFTVFDDPERIILALQAGARGYLLKDLAPARMLQALADIVSGGAAVSPGIARKILETFAPPQPTGDPLTPRELQVLTCLVDGRTYDDTAKHLGIGLSTVQTHVRTVYAKLEVGSKAEATREAIRRGLVSP
jgi:DNA-binding NarL/FixJ family response regulator